jgi:hypothetical protein
MEKELTIQAVVAVIRSTKGIRRSQKYSGSKRIRSFGVYAEVERFSKEIVIGFDYGASLNPIYYGSEAEIELEKVFANLRLKGLAVIEKQEPCFYGSSQMQTKYIVRREA